MGNAHTTPYSGVDHLVEENEENEENTRGLGVGETETEGNPKLKRSTTTTTTTTTEGTGMAREDPQRKKRRPLGPGDREREKAFQALAKVEYFGGDVSDRLCPAPSRHDFTTAYSVDVGQFTRIYVETQEKLFGEIAKAEGVECDVALGEITNEVERARSGSGKSAERVRVADGGEPSPSPDAAAEPGPSGSSMVARVAEDDVILKVGIYHPEKPMRLMQEVLVLGSQRLSELRDMIICQRDDIAKDNGMHVPSGFFFINGTFYDDTRDPKAIRYSKNVLQFIEHKQGQGKSAVAALSRGEEKDRIERMASTGLDHKFKRATMEDVTFASLELKLGSGHPYVYCHQGCCEHRLAFHDLRAVHTDDRSLRSEYPRTIYHKFERRVKCMVCEYDEGKYIVYSDDRAPCSPCAMCEDCHQSLHLDTKEKELYGGYQMYRYPTGVPRET